MATKLKTTAASASATTVTEDTTPAHSKDFDKYRYYYESGFWNKTMLKNAVSKGKITAAEYEEITGEPYEG